MNSDLLKFSNNDSNDKRVEECNRDEPQSNSFVVNRAQSDSPYIVVCDHALNRIPEQYDNLGLPWAATETHIAWDIGALDLALDLSELLDCPIAHSAYSRLLIDCNRDPISDTLIPETSDGTVIPGNCDLTQGDRRERIKNYYAPYHRAISELVEQRICNNVPTTLIAIHSFTPALQGVRRPWHICVIHGPDARIADPLFDGLNNLPGLTVGRNQPYQPSDGIYHSLSMHSRAEQLPSVMIEVRNDELFIKSQITDWAERIFDILNDISHWD